MKINPPSTPSAMDAATQQLSDTWFSVYESASSSSLFVYRSLRALFWPTSDAHTSVSFRGHAGRSAAVLASRGHVHLPLAAAAACVSGLRVSLPVA